MPDQSSLEDVQPVPELQLAEVVLIAGNTLCVGSVVFACVLIVERALDTVDLSVSLLEAALLDCEIEL